MDPNDLIAPTYHIHISIVKNEAGSKEFTTVVHAEDTPGQPPTPYRKPLRDRWHDFKERHQQEKRNDDPWIIMKWVLISAERSSEGIFGDPCKEPAKKYQDAARQRGDRVPGKKEAYAMACLGLTAEHIVRFAIHEHKQSKEFYICSVAKDGMFEATMYLDGGREKLCEKAIGKDHDEAVEGIVHLYRKRCEDGEDYYR